MVPVAMHPTLTPAQRAALSRLRWKNVDHAWEVGEAVAHWDGRGLGHVVEIDGDRALVRFPDRSVLRLKRHEIVRAALLPLDLLSALGGLEVVR